MKYTSKPPIWGDKTSFKSTKKTQPKDNGVAFSSKSYSKRLGSTNNNSPNKVSFDFSHYITGSKKTLRNISRKYLPKLRRFLGDNKLQVVYSVVGLMVLGVFISYVRSDTGGLPEVLSETSNGREAESIINDAILTPDNEQLPADNETGFSPQFGVTSYQGEVDGKKVVISQQPLPQDLIDGKISLKDIAVSVFDKITIEQLNTEKGVAYLINGKTSSQTVIFVYNKLLIFITSDQAMPLETWTIYINSLE